ncbi:MAG: PAS domain S-box protein [Planctomycetes bacterium]|nr:PAS domain S-box protein [Planctomycetota bacterium]
MSKKPKLESQDPEASRPSPPFHRETVELLASLVESAPDAMVVMNQKGEIVRINTRTEELFGYTREELLGRPVEVLMPERLRAKHPALRDAYLAAPKTRPLNSGLDLLGRRKDGTEFPVEISLSPIPLGEGMLVSSSIRDVSGRKWTEVRESEAKFRSIAENINKVFFLVDAKLSKTLYVSPAYERIWGRPCQELYAHPMAWAEAIHPDDRERIKHDTMPQGVLVPFEVEYRILTPAGATRWIRARGFPVLDEAGAASRFAGIAEDITESENAKNKLRLQATALESVANGIVITDKKGAILWVNSAFVSMTGYSFEEAVGKTPRLLKSGQHGIEFYRELWSTILSGKVWRGTFVNRRKNGTLYSDEHTITPVLSDAGEITHFITIMNDVTERQRLEEQLHRAQKMEAIGQLAGGVAHDFNNLLTIINGYSEIVLTKIPPADPLRKSVRAIGEAGTRAAALTRQLLAFSRQAVIEPKVLDLNAAVKETEKMLRRLIGEDVILTTVLDAKIGRVKVDPGQLSQVLMNLAVNARDAMPKGGKLTIETAKAELDANYLQARPNLHAGIYTMLAVSDSGSGMSKEVRARLFEPFFTTKAMGKGTGLGLAVVHGIIVQSGGHIEVYSESGIGTTFKIYLPSLDEPVYVPERAEDAHALSGTETILFVEDEDGVRTLSALSLESAGYTVLQARDGEEALRLLDCGGAQADLLATDVVMPGMNGRELADVLHARFPKLKVLFMSGYTDDAVVRHGILHAEVAFLQKPYTPRTLLAKVRQVLDQKESG